MESMLLCKDVILIKNAVSDPDKLYEIVLRSKEEKLPRIGKWTEWAPWGYYSKAYPLEEQGWQNETTDSANLIKEALDSFWFAMKEYKEKYFNKEYFDIWGEHYDIPTSWDEMVDPEKNPGQYRIGDILFAESINTNPTQSLSMEYHKDRRMWLTSSPSFFNYNIYINDDYEGGEIQFIDEDSAIESTYIDKDGVERQCWMIDDPVTYRMKAGDGLLFRTDVGHAVFPIKGSKIYLRQFLIGKTPEEFIKLQNELSREELKEKLKEIEREGFEKKMWDARVYSSKDKIEHGLHDKAKVYILKSNNDDLISKPFRFSYDDENEHQPLFITDPLYVENERREPTICKTI